MVPTGTERSSSRSTVGLHGRGLVARWERRRKRGKRVMVEVLACGIGLRYNGGVKSPARRRGAGAMTGRCGLCLAAEPHRPPVVFVLFSVTRQTSACEPTPVYHL